MKFLVGEESYETKRSLDEWRLECGFVEVWAEYAEVNGTVPGELVLDPVGDVDPAIVIRVLEFIDSGDSEDEDNEYCKVEFDNLENFVDCIFVLQHLYARPLANNCFLEQISKALISRSVFHELNAIDEFFKCLMTYYESDMIPVDPWTDLLRVYEPLLRESSAVTEFLDTAFGVDRFKPEVHGCWGPEGSNMYLQMYGYYTPMYFSIPPWIPLGIQDDRQPFYDAVNVEWFRFVNLDATKTHLYLIVVFGYRLAGGYETYHALYDLVDRERLLFLQRLCTRAHDCRGRCLDESVMVHTAHSNTLWVNVNVCPRKPIGYLILLGDGDVMC